MSYDSDPGMEAEALESERLEADMEMAELEAAGDEAWRRIRKARMFRDRGDTASAARVCPHSWIGPAPDGSGRPVCRHCGSVVTNDWPPVTVEACTFEPND